MMSSIWSEESRDPKGGIAPRPSRRIRRVSRVVGRGERAKYLASDGAEVDCPG